jgi:hypothetical protein
MLLSEDSVVGEAGKDDSALCDMAGVMVSALER